MNWMWWNLVFSDLVTEFPRFLDGSSSWLCLCLRRMGCLDFWEGRVRCLSWLGFIPSSPWQKDYWPFLYTWMLQCSPQLLSPVMKTGCQARTHAWVYFAWPVLRNDLPVSKAQEKCWVRRKVYIRNYFGKNSVKQRTVTVVPKLYFLYSPGPPIKNKKTLYIRMGKNLREGQISKSFL